MQIRKSILTRSIGYNRLLIYPHFGVVSLQNPLLKFFFFVLFSLFSRPQGGSATVCGHNVEKQLRSFIFYMIILILLYVVLNSCPNILYNYTNNVPCFCFLKKIRTRLDFLSIPQSGRGNVKTYNYTNNVPCFCFYRKIRTHLDLLKGEQMSKRLGGIKGCKI